MPKKIIDVLKTVIRVEREVISHGIPKLGAMRRHHTDNMKNLIIRSSVDVDTEQPPILKIEIAVESTTLGSEENPFALIKISFENYTLVYDEWVGMAYELKNNQFIFAQPQKWFDFTPIFIGYLKYGC